MNIKYIMTNQIITRKRAPEFLKFNILSQFMLRSPSESVTLGRVRYFVLSL
jgi:hypothetical protein